MRDLTPSRNKEGLAVARAVYSRRHHKSQSVPAFNGVTYPRERHRRPVNRTTLDGASGAKQRILCLARCSLDVEQQSTPHISSGRRVAPACTCMRLCRSITFVWLLSHVPSQSYILRHIFELRRSFSRLLYTRTQRHPQGPPDRTAAPR